MAVRCPRCGLRTIRSSQFRLFDLPRLFLLRSPMRCKSCRTRFYITVFERMRLRREAREHRPGPKPTSKAAFD